MSTKMCFSEVVAFKNKYLKQNFIPKSKTLKRLLTWKIEFYKSWIPPNIVVFKILFPSRVEKLVFNKKTFNSCRLKKNSQNLKFWKVDVFKIWRPHQILVLKILCLSGFIFSINFPFIELLLLPILGSFSAFTPSLGTIYNKSGV